MRIAQIAASTLLCFCSCQAIAGAWDVGPFENDDALDWVWELSKSDDFAVVEDALQRANSSSGYLEAPTGSIALAAAEVVAALNGQPRALLPPEVSAWVVEHDTDLDESLLQAARKAIVQVRNAELSELAQLWSDSEELLTQWHHELDNLAMRLR